MKQTIIADACSTQLPERSALTLAGKSAADVSRRASDIASLTPTLYFHSASNRLPARHQRKVAAVSATYVSHRGVSTLDSVSAAQAGHS
jgi:hypothetical protein